MAIFISYSHQNRDFVDHLASRLTQAHVHIWLDRWELRVGDSLTTRVQTALESASAVLVCLSGASVASEWCRRELNAGLVRELEEKKIIVLPLLLEDCDVPLFLRDKYRADFRADFERGFADVVAALAPITNLYRARIESPNFLTDWAIDYTDGPRVCRRLTLVDHSATVPYIVITEVEIVGSETATEHHQLYVAAGLEWWSDRLLFEALGSAISDDLQILLEDQFPRTINLALKETRYGASYDVRITSRLLGTDTGSNIIMLLGRQLRRLIEHQRKASRPPTPEELSRISEIRARRDRGR